MWRMVASRAPGDIIIPSRRRAYLWVPAEYRLADEVCEVERVADEGHPAEEVRQAEHAQRQRHVDDGPQIPEREDQ